MKKLPVGLSAIAISLCLFLSCSKGDDGGSATTPPPPAEENLRISTNAGSLNVIAGAEFSFNVVVESKMPADGVKIEYTVRGESDNVNYPQGPAIETKAASTAVRITGLPRQKFCVTNITVTSLTKSSNTANTNFRVVYK